MTQQKPEVQSASQAPASSSFSSTPTDQHRRHEDNSLSVTPKDIEPGDVTAKDTIERPTDSTDADERQQAMLDDANDLSFPASDPTSVAGGITRIEKPASPA